MNKTHMDYINEAIILGARRDLEGLEKLFIHKIPWSQKNLVVDTILFHFFRSSNEYDFLKFIASFSKTLDIKRTESGNIALVKGD